MLKKGEPAKLLLRLDKSLHRRLTTEARRQARSLNGEIAFRLRKSLEIEAGNRPAA